MVAVNAKPAGLALPARPTVAPGASPRQAAEVPEGFWYSVKRRVLGPPLVTEQLANERLSKPLAAGIKIPLELADCPDRRLAHAAARPAGLAQQRAGLRGRRLKR
jgi:hypothetical protein